MTSSSRHIFLLTVIITVSNLVGNVSSAPKLPIGIFYEDSLKIGESITYSLSFRYSPDQEVVFPDSTYNYFPFELISKKFFPTTTANGLSEDSAIYKLRTFEINKLLSFSLPVFIIDHGTGDTTKYFASIDTVYQKQYVDDVPKQLKLKSKTDFQYVSTRFNYPHFLSITLALAIIGLSIFLIFKKRILKAYNLYTLRKSHVSFIKNFETYEGDFDKENKIFSLENAVSLWKIYLARLENKPIISYTTTEIIALFNNESLKEGLQVIDSAIYGGVLNKETEKALDILKRFSHQRFLLERNKIRKKEVE